MSLKWIIYYLFEVINGVKKIIIIFLYYVIFFIYFLEVMIGLKKVWERDVLRFWFLKDLKDRGGVWF